MLKIRLSRVGRKNLPHYRIVVIESTSKRDGKFIENIGTYHPTNPQNQLSINKTRLDYWLSQGAQFSEGLYRLHNNKSLWNQSSKT